MRVVEIEEKPAKPKGNIAFLGVYFLNKELLKELLYATVPQESTIFYSMW